MADDDVQLSEYRKSLHQKATATIQGLLNDLDRDPVLVHTDDQTRPKSRLNGTPEGVSSNVEYSDRSYSSAKSRLREMVTSTATPSIGGKSSKKVLFSTPKHDTMAVDSHLPMALHVTSPLSAPRPEEFLYLLQTQSSRVQMLHQHNEQLQSELGKLKWKLQEVVEENRVLHEELKQSVMEELKVAAVGNVSSFQPAAGPTYTINVPTPTAVNQPLTRYDHEKWRTEVERLNSLHDAKSASLEAQLHLAREQNARSEKQISALENKLRNLEAVVQTGIDPSTAGPIGGLCIHCAQNQALLPAPAALNFKRNVDNLTRDRDELSSQVSMLKATVEDLRRREEDAYQQVKSCIEMVDQSQLDMAQALIEREQLREELENIQSRFDDHIAAMQTTLSEECDLARREGQGIRDELEAKVKESLQQLAEMQCTLDKCNRDKMSLAAELEVARAQLDNVDLDYSKTTDNMKVSAAQANIERNLAVQQTMRLKQELEQSERDRHAEKARLKDELEDVKRRLHRAEKEVLEAKEECIQMHNSNQSLENALHQAQLMKESLERNFSDNVDAAEKRAEIREAELNALVENLQAKHAHTAAQLEEIIRKQESLVQKLREECRTLMSQLEQSTTKYRTENKTLKTSNEHLRSKLDQTARQCQELNNRLTQQSHLQEKMRERLHEMDGQCQLSSQQKLDLLAKESVLLRDRQQLARQVEYLQRQLLAPDGNDPVRDKVNAYLGSRTAVDDVLTDVYHELRQDAERSVKFKRDDKSPRQLTADHEQLQSTESDDNNEH